MQNTFSLTINNITLDQIERVTQALEPSTTVVVARAQAATPPANTPPANTPPAIPQPAASTQTFKTELEVVLETLGDPRYELRSLEAINAALNAEGYIGYGDYFSFQNFLSRHNVAYHTKTRRRDGALLFGLLKEPQGAEQGVVPEPGPVVRTTDRKHDKLMELLNDQRYAWRTAKTLKEKVGFVDNDELFDHLDDNDIEYETHVRENGDMLVALSSRI